MLKAIYSEVQKQWNQSTEQALKDFIELPALSPDFDPNWQGRGLLHESLKQAQQWAQAQGIRGLKCELIEEEGFTPCLYVEIAASAEKKNYPSVFMYGHLDKQPENIGWDDDKGPWMPVVQNGKLYGRGGADDGYSLYCQLTAIKSLQNLGIATPRMVGLFETCEESGSVHYDVYLEKLKDRFKDVGLVVALDSSCGDYDRLWITRSLRGMIGGALTVQVLDVGVHSGEASGIVPSSFMIARSLLDRVEDSKTGNVIGEAFHTKITDKIRAESQKVAAVLGEGVKTHYPWYGGTHALHQDPAECVIHRNWEPKLTITGIDGVPSVEMAGNVLRPFTRIKIGMRLPPDVDAVKASKAFAEAVESNPPFGASVHYKSVVESNGWVAKDTAAWLESAFSRSSQTLWQQDACYLGMGASIPLLNVFSKQWPNAQFMVAGVLGPKSNAHGPNESLDIDYAVKLTASVAYVITEMPSKE